MAAFPKFFSIKKIFLFLSLIVFLSLILGKLNPSPFIPLGSIPNAIADAPPCPDIGTTINSGISIENGFLTIKNPTDASKFAFPFPTPGPCIIGNPAAIPQFSIPDFNEIKSLYFDQSKQGDKKWSTDDANPDANQGTLNNPYNPNQNQNSKRLFYVKRNLTIGGNLFPTGGDAPVVIFVQGDLTINNDITFGEAQGGIVFVVNGATNIKTTVETINAVFISFGQFCDTWDGSTCNQEDKFDKQLTINGSVINLGSTTPIFKRQNSTNDSTHPAEVINYQPKYLVLFKDIFARNLTIWNEIQ